MNPGKKDDRSESYFMVGGSQVTLRSGGIWLGPAGPLGESEVERVEICIRAGDHGLNRSLSTVRCRVGNQRRNAYSGIWRGHLQGSLFHGLGYLIILQHTANFFPEDVGVERGFGEQACGSAFGEEFRVAGLMVFGGVWVGDE